MTVRETLEIRVQLKLGSLISKKAQAERVEELLQELNLSKSADTIVSLICCNQY
jgi:ABC-type multidrug transport system ATPase subunit